MNYLKIYCNLIRKAEKRGYTKKKANEQGLYVEGHHTFPVSIFGKNKRIVYLTAREHYIAHCLLERIYLIRYGIGDWRTHKMIMAHIMMKGSNKFCGERYFNSYLYEATKLRVRQIPTTEEVKLQMSLNRRGSKWWYKGEKTKFSKECPADGWKRGRPGINIGREVTKETREKIRIGNVGKKLSPKSIENANKKKKGRVCWNNGEENKMSKECPGEGWVRGKGMYWTDGEQQIISLNQPGPEWVEGTLNTFNLLTPEQLNILSNSLRREVPILAKEWGIDKGKLSIIKYKIKSGKSKYFCIILEKFEAENKKIDKEGE
jgi:hypothetical protein